MSFKINRNLPEWMYRKALRAGLLFVCVLFINLFFLHVKETFLSKACISLTVLLASIGFIIEVNFWLNSRWVFKFQKSVVGKVIIWGVIVFSGACSAGAASEIVNQYSGVPGKFLPYTVTALSALTAIAVIFTFLGAASIVMLLSTGARYWVALIKIALIRNKDTDEVDKSAFGLMRVLGAITIFLLWVTYSSSFYKGLGWLGPNLSYILDMDGNDPCIQPPMEVVTRLNDSFVLEARHGATKFSVKFEKRFCPISRGIALDATEQQQASSASALPRAGLRSSDALSVSGLGNGEGRDDRHH